MIRMSSDSIFLSSAKALVNPVNTVGVMGKGLAYQFKKKYYTNYILYNELCANSGFDIGDIFITQALDGKMIVNFPTKKHWRNPSRFEYIEAGLITLARRIKEIELPSISLPMLGCGLGGLEKSVVLGTIKKHLSELECDIIIHSV